jgi:hypothetical protein
LPRPSGRKTKMRFPFFFATAEDGSRREHIPVFLLNASRVTLSPTLSHQGRGSLRRSPRPLRERSRSLRGRGGDLNASRVTCLASRAEPLDRAPCHDHRDEKRKCDFRFSSPRPKTARGGDSSLSPSLNALRVTRYGRRHRHLLPITLHSSLITIRLRFHRADRGHAAVCACDDAVRSLILAARYQGDLR